MIVLDLCCKHEHRFEGWFASAQAFEDQLAQKMVSCPICASNAVHRLPSAPYVQTRTSHPLQPDERKLPANTSDQGSKEASPSSQLAGAVISVLRQLSQDAENVGERLPEEARRIHYGEAEARNIRGKASGKEVEELLEEGILVLPLLPGDDELH